MGWNITSTLGIKKVDRERLTKSGLPYRWKYSPPRKNNPARAELSIEMNVDYSLSFEREHWGRSLAKMLGFARELQTGDEAFDKKVYIASDDPQIGDRLQTDDELRRLIKGLFDFGIQLITLNKGRLSVTMSKTYPRLDMLSMGVTHRRSIEPMLDDDQAEELVQALASIKRKLTVISSAMFGEVSRAPAYQAYARVANWTSGVLLTAGIVTFFFDRIAQPVIVNFGDFFIHTLSYSVAIIIVFLAVIFLVFGRSSAGYGVLRNFLLAGGAGIVLCTSEALYTINVRLDASAVTLYSSIITDKYESRSRKSGRSYHVRVRGWKAEQKDYSFRVNYSEYQSAVAGQRVNIYTHTGHLGYEWIERHEFLR